MQSLLTQTRQIQNEKFIFYDLHLWSGQDFTSAALPDATLPIYLDLGPALGLYCLVLFCVKNKPLVFEGSQNEKSSIWMYDFAIVLPAARWKASIARSMPAVAERSCRAPICVYRAPMLNNTLPFSKASARWHDGTPVKESYLNDKRKGNHQWAKPLQSLSCWNKSFY